MFHSTIDSHVTIMIITVIRAQISRQVLSEKVTVRLEPDQILRETGRLYNFERLYIMQPCGILQSAKYQICVFPCNFVFAFYVSWRLEKFMITFVCYLWKC